MECPDLSKEFESVLFFQVDANFAFDMYREQYFEGGISSCYFWDQDNGGFAGWDSDLS